MAIYFAICAGLILLDIVSGLLKALYERNFKSCRMRDGLFHKAGELVVLGLLAAAERYSPIVGLDTGLPLFKAGSCYIMLMELGSILENLRSFTPGLDGLLKNKPGKREG